MKKTPHAQSRSIDDCEDWDSSKVGPLSSPRERGPDFNLVFPRYPVPEVGADIPTMICGCSRDNCEFDEACKAATYYAHQHITRRGTELPLILHLLPL